MRTEPTKQQKELYKKIAPILGADSKVIEYSDDSNTNSIYILNCPDPIDDKVMSDICIFGHTHREYMNEKNDIIYLNPGALQDKKYVIYNGKKFEQKILK